MKTLVSLGASVLASSQRYVVGVAFFFGIVFGCVWSPRFYQLTDLDKTSQMDYSVVQDIIIADTIYYR